MPLIASSAPRLSPRLRLALGLSVLLFVVRVSALRGLGWGDSEALYACYALFPQAAYLDHPGLVGVWMRAIGLGALPTPGTAHLVVAILSGLMPWVGGAAARAMGARPHDALLTVLALTLVPQLALGLSALTPDVPLALTWLGGLAFAGSALRADPGSRAALLSWSSAGLLIGLAFTAKLSGVLLGAAVLVTLLRPVGRAHLISLGPIAGLVLAVTVASPVVIWEAQRGWPMLRHRLLESPPTPTSLAVNLGKLLGGQMLYVGPLFLIGGALLARELWGKTNRSVGAELTWNAFLVPAVPLLVLSLGCPRSEPHWLAPAFLSLALHWAVIPQVIPRWVRIGSGMNGALVLALGWVWVQTPWPITLLGRHYHPRYDLANDLHASTPIRDLLRESVERSVIEAHRFPVIVAPHWILCAQAQAAVGPAIRVGCNTPARDDFDTWYPRAQWLGAPVILFLSDDRFPQDAATHLPGRSVTAVSKTDVRRGGRVVRTLRVSRLEVSHGTATRDPSPGLPRQAF